MGFYQMIHSKEQCLVSKNELKSFSHIHWDLPVMYRCKDLVSVPGCLPAPLKTGSTLQPPHPSMDISGYLASLYYITFITRDGQSFLALIKASTCLPNHIYQQQSKYPWMPCRPCAFQADVTGRLLSINLLACGRWPELLLWPSGCCRTIKTITFAHSRTSRTRWVGRFSNWKHFIIHFFFLMGPYHALLQDHMKRFSQIC